MRFEPRSPDYGFALLLTVCLSVFLSLSSLCFLHAYLIGKRGFKWEKIKNPREPKRGTNNDRGLNEPPLPDMIANVEETLSLYLGLSATPTP